jgi:ABC-type dipeptide/oligopeptide/nickel transport system permease subunit
LLGLTPTPSWGNILSEGRQYIKCCPWITTFSGLAIMLAVLAFNIVGEARSAGSAAARGVGAAATGVGLSPTNA